MPSRTSDVQLVIRARDEAERVITNVSDALQELLGVQRQAGSSAAGRLHRGTPAALRPGFGPGIARTAPSAA